MKIIPHDGVTVWERYKFPTFNHGTRWLGKNRKMNKPYCWTPTEYFHFGGKQFIPLYPCVAFETRNFGYVIQKLWDHMVIGQE